GQMFSTTWQMMVNLMGGGSVAKLLDPTIKLSAAMKRKMNRLAYAELNSNGKLSDGGDLFNVNDVSTAGGHANLSTGVLSTPEAYTDAWSSMSAKMRQQKPMGADAGALNVGPRWVLFPPAIRGPILTGLRSTSTSSTGNAGIVNISGPGQIG